MKTLKNCKDHPYYKARNSTKFQNNPDIFDEDMTSSSFDVMLDDL